MTHTKKLALLAAAAMLRLPSALPAQNTPPAGANSSLESIGDDRLMNELADRGLDSLLDRFFDLHHTPESEQKAVRSTEALRDLDNNKLPASEKERKVKQIVEGLSTTLNGMSDPNRIMREASLLLEFGAKRDSNLLDYWGENPATQARLRPVAQAIYDMLGRAAKVAKEKADAMSNKITPQNQDTVGVQWQALSDLSGRAEYYQHMPAAYDVALSLPKAERIKFIDGNIEYLKQFDTADSQVQAAVRVMIGKLDILKGNYDEAITLLDSVATDPKKEIQPPPDIGQQYEARYFEDVAKLEAGKIDQAKAGLDQLIAWQKASMPKDTETQNGIAAAAEMLRYRIFSAEADRSRDSAAKQAAENSANDVLLKLSKDRPELRGIIYQQLVERLPKNAPVANMDPLLLQGLEAKAYGEANKPQGTAVDHDIVERGLAAAKEMATRSNAPNITPQMRDQAARLVPYLLEGVGRKIEAADAYLKYAQANATVHPQPAQGALDDAGRLVFELRKSDPDDPKVADLYDRFLPVAIGAPFNRTQLAFFYAQRMGLQNKPQEALKYYRMVPKGDRNYASAQYQMMLSMQDMLDTKLPDAQRALVVNDLLRQAQQVKQSYASSQDAIGRERAAIATLTEAKVLGADLKKPAQTLQALNGFEQAVAGTPDEKILVGDALLTRVNANMALGQLKAATDMLVALLNHTGGAQGAEYVRGLLDRLDKDLDKAQARHDEQAMRDIAISEANLSGFLVDWARNNSSPEIRKFTYQYMVFDARTKRIAGTLAQNPAERDKLLRQALAAYQNLQQPANLALFKATLDPQKVASGDIDPSQGDPNVQLGIALTDFELKDYKEAAELLGNLLNNGKLGGPTLAIADSSGNDRKIVDNDLYWEATYKLYRSNVELAKNPSSPDLAGTKQGLKNLLVRGGIPAKWQDRFEELRKQIIPDFDVSKLASATTQPQAPASQPVSRR